VLSFRFCPFLTQGELHSEFLELKFKNEKAIFLSVTETQPALLSIDSVPKKQSPSVAVTDSIPKTLPTAMRDSVSPFSRTKNLIRD
jgi:hypothetical protein